MIATTLAAEAFRANLTDEVKTIFEAEQAGEYLNTYEEDIDFLMEEIENFVTVDIPAFISASPNLFIGESKEEVLEKLTTFITHAVKGYLEELAEFETIARRVVEEGEQDDEVALELMALLERAKLYALAKGQGALSYLEEVRLSPKAKKALKIAAGVGAGLAAAGAAYGAYKHREDIEKFAKGLIQKLRGKEEESLAKRMDREIAQAEGAIPPKGGNTLADKMTREVAQAYE